MTDPANRGLARGWQRGAFAGVPVSVPHAIDANQFKGAAGTRNYNGSIAWYRTTFTAPEAGAYALAFSSANFQASVWIDGRAAASHRGSYLPFEARAQLTAGEHTVVVRIDWRDPDMQARAGFHRTWFNWGGINGQVNVQRLGESELSRPTLQTKLASEESQPPSATHPRNPSRPPVAKRPPNRSPHPPTTPRPRSSAPTPTPSTPGRARSPSGANP